MAALLVEECVARTAEAGPDFLGLALGHGTGGLPGVLQLLELVGGRVPVGRFLESLGFLDEFHLLLEVRLAVLVFLLDAFLVLGKECVRCGLEPFDKRVQTFLGHHADVLPVFLDFLHGLVLVLPEDCGVGDQVLDLLAEFLLAFEVLLALDFTFFDKLRAVVANLGKQGLELVAEFHELRRGDRADVLPLVAEFAQLVEHVLAAGFLGEHFHLFEDACTVLLVVPGFPLAHFLEALGRALVLEPQVVVLELLFAHDVLPFGERVAELLAQILEVFVLVETLYALDKLAKLFGVFFVALLGGLFEGRNLFLELVAQGVVTLEVQVGTFEKRELFPFTHDGVYVLLGRFRNFGIGDGLQHVKQLLAGLVLVGGVNFRFGNCGVGLLEFLALEEGEIEALYRFCIHDGLLLVPFGNDFGDAVCLFVCIVRGDDALEFFKEGRKLLLARFLLGVRLFGGSAFGIGFGEELLVACVDFVKGCLLVAHAEGFRLVHQGFELVLDLLRVLFAGERVRLLDQRVPLAVEQGFGPLAAVFDFLLGADLFDGDFPYRGVLRALRNIRERGFRFNAVHCGLCNFFLGILIGGVREHVDLARLLDEFQAELGIGHGFCKFFGIAGVLDVVYVLEYFLVCRFTIVLEHLGDFFKITRFSQATYTCLAVLLRNCRKGRNQGKFFNGCGSNATIFIRKGNAFQGALFANVHVFDSFESLFRVGILPFRSQCIQ